MGPAALLAAMQFAWTAPAHADQFAPGNYTYTVPAGVTRVRVKVAGGGGGMGGSDSASGTTGGRAHVIAATLNVTPGQVITGTVGGGGTRGAQGSAASGGAGGAGTGNGGAGGKSGANGYSGSGGGGGGGSSLALAGTVILKAGSGGGGQGGALNVTSKTGGDASGFASAANCSTSVNGGTGTDFTGDGGGGGGGGGGYTGGTGGTGHADGSTGGTASGGGGSCRSSTAALFAVAPGTTFGAQASGNVVSNGAAGYVTIDVEPNAVLTKAFGAASIDENATTTLTFTLANPSGASAQTGLSFTDTLPAGLVLAAVPTAAQCGGTVSGTSGGNTISLSGGSLAAGTSSCTVTATVKKAATQDAATCPDARTTNGAANVSGLSNNLTNNVGDQCLGITRAFAIVTIAKTSSDRAGAFAFRGTAANGNGFPTDGSYQVTTTAAGTPAMGAPVTLAAVETATVIEEVVPAGWRLSSASCEDLKSPQTGNPAGRVIGSVTDGKTLVIPAANVRAGAELVCSFTNAPAPPQVGGRVFLDNGAGGGTANDGVLNGGEGPLPGVVVRLTDCAAAVLSTTLTNGTGIYSLEVPAATATGTALCVEQTNTGARVSTGASIGSTALPSGMPVATAGNTFTYTRVGPPERIAFHWNGTSPANLNFGDVDNGRFAASGTKAGQPGNTVSYAHTFTAGSAGAVRFSVAGEAATPALAGWSTRILADPACTGSLQPGAAQLYPPATASTGVAAAGAAVCVVVQRFIPANAPVGASSRATIRADFDHANANPALAASFMLEDLTTVANAALDLRKEVRNFTQNADFGLNNQARPGETLEYRITYTNHSDTTIHDMTVNDTTPGYTSFASATTGTTPATLGACTKRTPANPTPAAAVPCTDAQTTGGTGAIEWRFNGSVAPGGTGTVLFQVRVN